MSSNLSKWQARIQVHSGSLVLEPTYLNHYDKHGMTELGAGTL